jgi:hypothetical protein
LHRGLEKATSDRWPNMRTLGRALAQWLCDRGVTSDIAGVELESTWFNPELVTPPPIAPRRTESVGSDAPAWTKRSGAASHIESRAVEVPAKPQRHWRGRIAVALTFLASAGAAVFFLTGTPQGARTLRQIEQEGHRLGIGRAAVPLAAKSLERCGVPPARLQFDHLARSSAALLPGLPYTLIPMHVVPVEKLRLVSAPARRRVDTGATPLMASPMSGAGTAVSSTAAVVVPAASAPAKAAPSVDTR